jgi:hypothetical protein
VTLGTVWPLADAGHLGKLQSRWASLILDIPVNPGRHLLRGRVFAYGYAVRELAKSRPVVLVTTAHGIHNAIASSLVGRLQGRQPRREPLRETSSQMSWQMQMQMQSQRRSVGRAKYVPQGNRRHHAACKGVLTLNRTPFTLSRCTLNRTPMAFESTSFCTRTRILRRTMNILSSQPTFGRGPRFNCVKKQARRSGRHAVLGRGQPTQRSHRQPDEQNRQQDQSTFAALRLPGLRPVAATYRLAGKSLSMRRPLRVISVTVATGRIPPRGVRTALARTAST